MAFARIGLALAFLLGASAIHAQAPRDKQLVNSIGMKLVLIESGEFVMGTSEKPPQTRAEWLTRDEDEMPAHKVRLLHPFFLGAFEVTNAQFETFAPDHSKLRGKFGNSKADDEPVTYVTWQQAVDFCKWLTKREGKPYRLPTEAEWEYACRAGTTTVYNVGDAITFEQANLGRAKDGITKFGPTLVGSYPPNAWGLHDMHGNVAEWCHDWYGPYDASNLQINSAGRDTGHARVVRGWSWLIPSGQLATRFARSANRSGHLPDDANRYTGFRVVLGEMQPTRPLPPAEAPRHQRGVSQTPAPTAGPDPSVPYFIDYTAKKAAPVIPPNTWGPIFSNHNHFSSVCVCPNGDVLAVWYTCVGESDRQLAQAASRLRAGSDRWEPASLFFGVPDVNCHAPVLLRDGKRIYHFCTLSLHGWDYASNMMRYSDDSGATWSAPRIILSRDDPDFLSQPCSALVAKDGTLVLACDGDNHKDERLMLSGDQGKTWRVAKGDMRKSAGGKYVIHPAIVQRGDGALLSFLRGPDPMPMQISRDLGDTWETHESPFSGLSSGQKAHALKLASGAMLLLTIDRTKKVVGGGTMVALSLDDGKTWPHVRKVDAPVGGYMSSAQAPNGLIYLIGSRMHFAVCNEAWLRQGMAVK